MDGDHQGGVLVLHKAAHFTEMSRLIQARYHKNSGRSTGLAGGLEAEL